MFVCGQIITKFFIEPIHEQKRLIGEIADSLIFYANLYGNPEYPKTEKTYEASKVLRQQASQLRAKTHAIPWYKLWQFLSIVPKGSNVVEASSNLIGLSNVMCDDHYQRALKEQDSENVGSYSREFTDYLTDLRKQISEYVEKIKKSLHIKI